MEVRLGNAAVVEDNPSLGTKDLDLETGLTWNVSSQAENVYYRRDADPDHPNGQMTQWYERDVSGRAKPARRIFENPWNLAFLTTVVHIVSVRAVYRCFRDARRSQHFSTGVCAVRTI